jgi:hypothetical protein
MFPRLAPLLLLLALLPAASQPPAYPAAFFASGRTLATRSYYASGAMCAIVASGARVSCWWPPGASDATDRTFSFAPPTGYGLTFLHVVVHQDVWALTNTGDIVLVLNAGGQAPGGGGPLTSQGPVPPWAAPVPAPAVTPATLGVIGGPFLAFELAPGLNGSSTYAREACAATAAGEVQCWSLPLGAATALSAAVPGAVAVAGGAAWLLTAVRVASPSFCGPSAGGGSCTSFSGPFVALAHVPFPAGGRADAPGGTTVSGPGQGAQAGAARAAGGVLCSGARGGRVAAATHRRLRGGGGAGGGGTAVGG